MILPAVVRESGNRSERERNGEVEYQPLSTARESAVTRVE